ncbi:MAG TPA: DNA mismatch repair endonuclease MutL [Methanoregulaceae archaeon]|nr:DNA mismatch repair endonuclease MutL [Methanoregulaceae archaeon]
MRVDDARICVLDKDDAARIAAGEVVERPASVVKELVENAIDAGSERIEVEVISKGGSIRKIRVSDDGEGMHHTDAGLAFTSHATSKIQSISDLPECRTLGFRGEALASIASVARVTITTKPRKSSVLSGTRITSLGGEIVENKEVGCPEGTTVLVEDIFFNTPARKKFQKSQKAEIAYITAMMERIVLSHPAISFRFLYNGREKFVTQTGGDPGSAISALFGREYVQNLIKINETGKLVALEGYISRPTLCRQSPYQMFLSVNSRVVYSRSIIEAIKAGYGTLLPSDTFPVVFLEVSINRELVDVNVHPAKRQIRISREEEVKSEIEKIIGRTLGIHDLVPGKHGESLPEMRKKITYTNPVATPGLIREPTPAEIRATDRQLRQTSLFSTQDATHPGVPDMEVIGQLGETYILARTAEEDLLLIDQHAAHERILYEQIADQEGPQVSQELISPITLHVSPGEYSVLKEHLNLFQKEGFGLEEFGSGSFLVRSVPVFLGRNEDPSLIRDIIAGLLDEDIRTGIGERERIRRVVACRGAIKAGTICTPDQCRRLVAQLKAAKNPWTCPHGRPTMVLFPKKKIDAMFRRV